MGDSSLAEPKVEEDEASSRLDLSLDTSNSKIIGVSALDGSQNLLKAWQTSLNGIWDNIVEDYLSDVYTDVIEGYLIASIKLVGWFTFGTFLILKGAFLNSVYEQKQSGESYVTRDFQGELDHLLSSFSDLWEFGQRWWGLY